MTIRVTFACTHILEVRETADQQPVCQCGEHRITHVEAPPPHFVGTVTGPNAEYREMVPAKVNLAPESLALKPIEEDDHANS